MQYRFSGECPGRAYGYMLLGLLLSPLSNIAAWVLFGVGVMALGLVILILVVLPLLVTQLVAVVLLLGMAVLSLASPIIVGAMVGYVEALLGRKGDCRSPTAAGIFGAIAGFLGGIPFSALSIIAGVAEDTSGMSATEPPPTVVLLAMFLCFNIFFAVGGAIGGYWGIKEGAFCESCGVWYGKWTPAVRFGLGILKPLARTLNERIGEQDDNDAGAVEGLEDVDRLAEDQYPKVALKIRKCPGCPDAHVQWQATVNWEKSKFKQWFTIMLPARFSSHLESQLLL
jgi:hypothetical protein